MRLQIKIISKISSFSNKSEIRDANLGPFQLVNGFLWCSREFDEEFVFGVYSNTQKTLEKFTNLWRDSSKFVDIEKKVQKSKIG